MSEAPPSDMAADVPAVSPSPPSPAQGLPRLLAALSAAARQYAEAGVTRARRIVRRAEALWNRLGSRLAAGSARREAGTALVVVLYVAVNVARSALDEGIAKIHPAGTPGVSANSLHDGDNAIKATFAIWREGAVRLDGLLRFDPVSLARAQTVLELALVPLTFLVGFGVLFALRRRITSQPIRNLTGGAVLGVMAYSLLGVFNQLVELAILGSRQPISGLGPALTVTGTIRTLLLPLILLTLAVGVIQMEREKPQTERLRWWRGAPTSYRVLIVAAALYGLLFLFGIPAAQSGDALRLWTTSPRLALTGLAGTTTLSTALAVMAWRLGTDASPARVVMGRQGTKNLLGVGAAITAVGLFSYAGPFDLGRQAWSAGALAAGLLVLVVGLLSLPIAEQAAAEAKQQQKVAEATDRTKKAMPALLALSPPTVLTAAIIRAAMPSILGRGSNGWLIGYAGATAALAVILFTAARKLARWSEHAEAGPRRALYFGVSLSAGLTCAIVYVLVIANPWYFGPFFGVTALIATFLTAVVLVFGTVGYLMESRALPAVLDFLWLRRLPIIAGLVVWALVTNRFATHSFHDVTTVEDSTLPANAQLSVEEAFARWQAANGTAEGEPVAAGAPRRAVPLVFVAAAGGGLKAAAFTAATLDCLFRQAATPATHDTEGATNDRPCATQDSWLRLFAASGASGGSVGIASVLAQRAGGASPQEPWVSKRLGRDLLSAELGWQLFVEVPNAVLGLNPGLDRAEVLATAWRRVLTLGGVDPGGQPFYRDRSDSGWDEPLLYLSGTNLNDGCRVNISNARASGPDPAASSRLGDCTARRVAGHVNQADTRDLADYLCGSNIDLATAAFLSARFPLVSPTGRVSCKTDKTDKSAAVAAATLGGGRLSIGDGGYRDNSGAASVLEAWDVIEPLVTAHNAAGGPCIVPILVEINNGYQGLGGSSPATDVTQLLAPAVGAAKVFGGLSTGPIEQAAAEFSQPLSPGLAVRAGNGPLASRYFRVSLADHPGVTAPLGWSLSSSAVDDLVNQLDLKENQKTLQDLLAVLDPADDGALTCVAG